MLTKNNEKIPTQKQLLKQIRQLKIQRNKELKKVEAEKAFYLKHLQDEQQ